MNTDRLHYLDIAKGIGILLIIFGHTLGSNSFRHILYAFHIPLFFFVSGMLFHHRSYEHFITFLKKNSKGILLPYFVIAFLTLLLWYISSDRVISVAELQKQIFGIFYGSSKNSYLGFNVSLWFLPVLFLTRVGFWLITKITNKKPFIFGILFILSIIGFGLFLYHPNIVLPFGLDTALTGMVFFGFGYLWSSKEDKDVLRKKYGIFLALFMLIITLGVAHYTYSLYDLQIDMRINRLNNYPLFYLGAISGISMVLAVSYAIGRNRILEYFGKRSLILFAWHTAVFFYLVKLLKLITLPGFIETNKWFVFPIFYTTAAILIILGLDLLLKKTHMKLLAIRG